MDVLEENRWVFDEEYVNALTIGEYHEASGVYSSVVRDAAILDKGLEHGYYKSGLSKAESRARLPHLRNSTRTFVMRTINDTLMKEAEEIGGDVYKGYTEYVYVNSCSSRLKFRWAEGGLWDLNYRYFNYVRDNKLIDFGHCGEGVEDYIEYTVAFTEFYGIYPTLYGDWEYFYKLWSGYFQTVADKYLDDLRRVVKRRLSTPECSLGPCNTCDAIVDCDRYEYKEKVI